MSEPYPEEDRRYELEHVHVWVIDTKYPPASGILAECQCSEIRLTLPSDVFDTSLDEPGDLYPPDWK